MILIFLTLLSALAVSAVAAYFSIAGLVAIFASAPVPIATMGITLEVAKLVTASWIYRNWEVAPRLLKYYFVIATVILSLITSMGIFGYLSKVHLDQSVPNGETAAKISLFDEKIKIERENIDVNRKALKQLDEAVDQVMGRSNDQKGAEKAVTIRRSQQKERTRLQAEIQADQKAIGSLNEESAPLRAEFRKIEAEVGPIKYIAAFIYEETASQDILEKAVRIVIMMIVLVFDPLAVLLLIAANWQMRKDEREELVHPTVPLYVADVVKPEEEIVQVEQESTPININLEDEIGIEERFSADKAHSEATPSRNQPEKEMGRYLAEVTAQTIETDVERLQNPK